MIVETAVFTCSICGERSKDICVYCTKDTCANHRCERCKRCSDCCECDVPLSVAEAQQAELEASSAPVAEAAETAPAVTPAAPETSPLAGEPTIEPQPRALAPEEPHPNHIAEGRTGPAPLPEGPEGTEDPSQ